MKMKIRGPSCRVKRHYRELALEAPPKSVDLCMLHIAWGRSITKAIRLHIPLVVESKILTFICSLDITVVLHQ
jgi:hypothetical protein